MNLGRSKYKKRLQKILLNPWSVVGHLRYVLKKFSDSRHQNRYLRLVHIRDIGSFVASQAVTWGHSASGISSWPKTQQIGLYKANSVVLHRPTGLALLPLRENTPLMGIIESGSDDYQYYNTNLRQFKFPSRLTPNSLKVFGDKSPYFLFNIRQRKTNFYHFLIDNLARLIFFLELFNNRVTILHFQVESRFISEYYTLIAEQFNCSFCEISNSGSDHIKIRGSVLFLEHLFVTNFNSQPHVLENRMRLEEDSQLSRMGLCHSELEPLFKGDNLKPKSWRSRTDGRIYKNNIGLFHYPTAMFDALYRFGRRVGQQSDELSLAKTPGLLIHRSGGSSRPRRIANEESILSATGFRQIDFSKLAVRDQISESYRTQVLVGLTGAGLTNCVFMQKDSLVIEITPVGYSLPPTDLFEEICQARGILYKRLFSTPVDENGLSEVNIEELKEALKMMP